MTLAPIHPTIAAIRGPVALVAAQIPPVPRDLGGVFPLTDVAVDLAPVATDLAAVTTHLPAVVTGLVPLCGSRCPGRRLCGLLLTLVLRTGRRGDAEGEGKK